jgi:hypothetical protein
MLATVIISLILALAVVFAIRSIIKSRATGGCESCGCGCSECPTVPKVESSSKD